MAALDYCRLLDELDTGDLERPIPDCLERSLLACRRSSAEEMILEARDCIRTAEHYASPLGLAMARMHLGVALALSQDFESALTELEMARQLFQESPDSRQDGTIGRANYLIGRVREEYRNSLLAQIGHLDAQKVLYSQQTLDLLEHVLNHYAATDDQNEYRDLTNLTSAVQRTIAPKLDPGECTAILKRVSTRSLPTPEKTALEAAAQACRNQEFSEMVRSAGVCLRYADVCRDRNGRAAALIYLALGYLQSERYEAALTACEESIHIYARDPHWPQRRSQAIATYTAARICGHHEMVVTELLNLNEKETIRAYTRALQILGPLVDCHPNLRPICDDTRRRIKKAKEW